MSTPSAAAPESAALTMIANYGDEPSADLSVGHFTGHVAPIHYSSSSSSTTITVPQQHLFSTSVLRRIAKRSFGVIPVNASLAEMNYPSMYYSFDDYD